MSINFGVKPEKQAALEKRMEDLEIREEDLEESFIRASGRGGQKLQKTAVCVRLKHLPTGIEVRVQRERSQRVNRYLARRKLCEKLESALLGDQAPAERAAEKKRRQKARRARRRKAKEREPDSRTSASTTDNSQ